MDSLVLSLPDYHLDDGRILFYQQDVVFHGNGLYLLKGKNGSGKTTLLSLLTGQEDREGLELYLDGQKVTSNNHVSYFDQCVSYLPQEPLVFPDKTIMENVLFPYDEKDKERAHSILILLGLEECMKKTVSSLSFGEKQRLAFARMLYQPKRILLFDEIDSGLDQESALILKNASRNCWRIISLFCLHSFPIMMILMAHSFMKLRKEKSVSSNRGGMMEKLDKIKCHFVDSIFCRTVKRWKKEIACFIAFFSFLSCYAMCSSCPVVLSF